MTTDRCTWWGYRLVPAACLLPLVLACRDRVPPDADGSVLALTIGEQILRVGALDTPEDLVFGRIQDVAALEDGRFIVLDGHWMNLRFFDKQGRLLDLTGRPGDGPEEFRGPLALAVRSDSILLVLDRSILLKEYLIEDSGLTYLRDVRLGFYGWDICAAGDRVFVQGLFEGYGVHEVDLEGRILSGFHPPPEDIGFDLGPAWQSVLDDEAVTGYLGCLEDPLLVVTASGWFPLVSAYHGNGELAWAAAIPDYRMVEPVLTPDGGQTWERGEGANLVRGMAVHPRGVLTVQTIHLLAGDDYSAAVPSTLIINAGSGRISRLQEVLPVLAAFNSWAAFGVTDQPYPTVVIQEASFGAGPTGRQ